MSLKLNTDIMRIYSIVFAVTFISIFFSCKGKDHVGNVSNLEILGRDSTQNAFWNNLSSLCGKSFEGVIIAGPANDTLFENKRLLMHVRSCDNNVIKIPFFVGNDSSRTWIFTRSQDKISLKHDHRHDDGSSDEVTMYGGWTSHSGSPEIQYFPADQETIDIIPAAMGNIWWIEVLKGQSFTYNLRRVNTERLFSVRFDLSRSVENPGPPWGWQD